MPLGASGSIHDPSRWVCVAIGRLCGTAPGAPIGGCDPPHPASIAAATQLLTAVRTHFGVEPNRREAQHLLHLSF
jgi:hypothetical protein